LQQAAAASESAAAELIAAKEYAETDGARSRLALDQLRSRVSGASTQLASVRQVVNPKPP